MTAVHLLNRSLTSALNGKMPYVAWHGRKPAVSYLRVFSYLAFIKELNHVSKLDDRSLLGVFISYAEGAKAYHELNLVTQRVRVVHDVVFDEGRGWAWDKAVDDGSAAVLHDFTIEYVWVGGAEGAQGASSSMSRSSSPAPTSSSALPCSSSPNSRELGSPSAMVEGSSAAAPISLAPQLTSPAH